MNFFSTLLFELQLVMSSPAQTHHPHRFGCLPKSNLPEALNPSERKCSLSSHSPASRLLTLSKGLRGSQLLLYLHGTQGWFFEAGAKNSQWDSSGELDEKAASSFWGELE